MIGARVKIVVVSLGADGAAACVDGRAVAVEGYDVGPSIDTTGAGDLFVAAWAWGDAAGLSVDDALRWAALYAALSVRVPTGAGGATRLERVRRGGHPPRPPGPAPARRAGRLRGRGAARRGAAGRRAARAGRRAAPGGEMAPAPRGARRAATPARLAVACVLLALAGLACGGADSPPPPDPRPSASASATATPDPRPALCEPLRARVVGHVDPAAGGELSGLVLSRSGLLWTHNDSGGTPQVFALSRTGQLRAAVTLAGATNVDWEDIAIRGRTLYVADIGDNLAARADIAIYRFAEPAPGTSAVPADRIVLRYPDGPRDAEALLIDPRSGTVVIVTKDIGGRSDVYVAGRNGLRRAARLRLGIGQAITAGDVSADGRDDRPAHLRPRVRVGQAPRGVDRHRAAARAVRRRRGPDRGGPGRGARAHPQRPRVLHRARRRGRAAAQIRARALNTHSARGRGPSAVGLHGRPRSHVRVRRPRYSSAAGDLDATSRGSTLARHASARTSASTVPVGGSHPALRRPRSARCDHVARHPGDDDGTHVPRPRCHPHAAPAVLGDQ